MTPPANFLLSRPNSVEYGNFKTTALLPSAKCTRPLFQGRTGCGGRPSGWHDIVTYQRLVIIIIIIVINRVNKNTQPRRLNNNIMIPICSMFIFCLSLRVCVCVCSVRLACVCGTPRKATRPSSGTSTSGVPRNRRRSAATTIRCRWTPSSSRRCTAQPTSCTGQRQSTVTVAHRCSCCLQLSGIFICFLAGCRNG